MPRIAGDALDLGYNLSSNPSQGDAMDIRIRFCDS